MYFFKIKKRYPCGEGIYGKGQITVFMALTMTIIFSVILTAVESARVNTVSLLAQTASELAVESALAEYNIPLYEMYGIFAIDGNREDFTKDILSYARKNEGKGFFKFEAKQAYMAETKMLYEMDYKLLEKEIVQYMKIRAPGAWLDEMTDTDNDLLDKAQNNKEILEENIASENAAAKYQESQEGGNAPSEPPLDDVKDPRKSLTNILKDGLLSCVLPKNMQVSENCLTEILNHTEEEQCPEIKDFEDAEEVTTYLDSMDLSKTSDSGFSELSSAMIVNEYILKHFKQAASKDKQYDCDDFATKLQYESEYIICGHKSDRDNLLDVVNRLVLIRMAFNIAYLFTDAAKKAEASAAATALTALIPFFQPLAYGLIMAAWSYAEGVMDVRSMMAGERVPLLKNSTNWKLSLTSLADGRLEGGTENKKGLLYEDYLRILLTFTGRKKKYERMENLMQANIRLAEGYENFNIRRCYYGMTCLFEYAVPSYFTVYTRYKGNYTMNNQWSECY